MSQFTGFRGLAQPGVAVTPPAVQTQAGTELMRALNLAGRGLSDVARDVSRERARAEAQEMNVARTEAGKLAAVEIEKIRSGDSGSLPPLDASPEDAFEFYQNRARGLATALELGDAASNALVSMVAEDTFAAGMQFRRGERTQARADSLGSLASSLATARSGSDAASALSGFDAIPDLTDSERSAVGLRALRTLTMTGGSMEAFDEIAGAMPGLNTDEVEIMRFRLRETLDDREREERGLAASEQLGGFQSRINEGRLTEAQSLRDEYATNEGDPEVVRVMDSRLHAAKLEASRTALDILDRQVANLVRNGQRDEAQALLESSAEKGRIDPGDIDRRMVSINHNIALGLEAEALMLSDDAHRGLVDPTAEAERLMAAARNGLAIGRKDGLTAPGAFTPDDYNAVVRSLRLPVAKNLFDAERMTHLSTIHALSKLPGGVVLQPITMNQMGIEETISVEEQARYLIGEAMLEIEVEVDDLLRDTELEGDELAAERGRMIEERYADWLGPNLEVKDPKLAMPANYDTRLIAAADNPEAIQSLLAPLRRLFRMSQEPANKDILHRHAAPSTVAMVRIIESVADMDAEDEFGEQEVAGVIQSIGLWQDQGMKEPSVSLEGAIKMLKGTSLEHARNKGEVAENLRWRIAGAEVILGTRNLSDADLAKVVKSLEADYFSPSGVDGMAVPMARMSNLPRQNLNRLNAVLEDWYIDLKGLDKDEARGRLQLDWNPNGTFRLMDANGARMPDSDISADSMRRVSGAIARVEEHRSQVSSAKSSIRSARARRESYEAQLDHAENYLNLWGVDAPGRESAELEHRRRRELQAQDLMPGQTEEELFASFDLSELERDWVRKATAHRPQPDSTPALERIRRANLSAIGQER